VVAPIVRNVVLTGFMGTGKSTVGRALADTLNFTFVDTDSIIEERHGPIPEIFASAGEEVFRGHEAAVAAELAQRRGLVIATGGRMMLDERNADALGATGVIVCLTATLEELLDRLLVDDQRRARPLLQSDNPAQRVADLLAERAEQYGQFPQVDTTGRPVDEIVDSIVELLQPS